MTYLPERLLSGYKSFIESHFLYKKEHYFQLAVEGQKPEILIIACCDSRAVPEMIFDARPGEIFVVRNVANLVPPYSPDDKYHATSAAIEYAVQYLKVKHIVVLGHACCGGISTALKGGYESLQSDDFIGKWISILAPVAKAVIDNKLLTKEEKQMELERLSVYHSLKNLETFTWVRARKEQGVLTLHGAWFDISNGQLWAMEQETDNFVRIKNENVHQL
ncbi:carbonic anhydrase [Bartonella sp. B30(2025)]